MGIVKDDELARRGDGLFEVFRLKTEGILLVKRHTHHFAPHEGDERPIRVIGGLRDDHFIAFVEEGAESEVDRLGGANAHEDLAIGIIVESITSFDVEADLIPEFRQTGIVGVEGIAILNRLNARLFDLPRRLEIRLANR